jgi:aryl-alcohol dehydrogenase-like predicted oxidoreductase
LTSVSHFFDTAECYGPYENEELLGDALKEVRTTPSGVGVSEKHMGKHRIALDAESAKRTVRSILKSQNF